MKEFRQLCFVQESHEEEVKRAIAELHQQYDRVRKRQFAEISKMKKMYEEIRQDHEYFKAMLCRAKND